jgi:chromosome segregation ATPase
MHTAGKVFSVLSTLLAIVFMFYTATIVNYRIEQRKQIDSVRASIPAIEAQAAELDVRRDTLRADIDRVTAQVTAATVLGLNQQETLEGRIAVLTDLINDANSKLKTWSLSLVDVQAENDSRDQEIQSLNNAIAAAENLKQNLINDNTKLTADLRDTREAVEKILAEIRENHDRLVKLSEEKQGATFSDRVAGAAR